MSDKISGSKVISDKLTLLSFGFVCMYLYRIGESYLAFDTGMKPKAVRRELASLKIDPETVTHVFLTHADRDHVGGLGLFAKAAVYLSKEEEATFDRSTPRFFGFIYSKPPDARYEALRDGQELRVGGATVRCIATPGHTAGSMSFLVDGSILIVGDELNLKQGKAVLDRRFISIDNAKRRESILKLARLPGLELLCTMHSGFTREVPKAISEWRSEAGTA